MGKRRKEDTGGQSEEGVCVHVCMHACECWGEREGGREGGRERGKEGDSKKSVMEGEIISPAAKL